MARKVGMRFEVEGGKVVTPLCAALLKFYLGWRAGQHAFAYLPLSQGTGRMKASGGGGSSSPGRVGERVRGGGQTVSLHDSPQSLLICCAPRSLSGES